MRIGIGKDIHRFTKGRDLIIGGVKIPYELGLLGHSDADVLIHAIMDALLGAAGLPDIGVYFPDSDEKYKGISSIILLKEVFEQLLQAGFIIENIDAVITAQAPKLRPYMEEMKEKISKVLGIFPEQINIKATTSEGLGYIGEGLGIEAQAVCLLHSPNDFMYENLTAKPRCCQGCHQENC